MATPIPRDPRLPQVDLKQAAQRLEQLQLHARQCSDPAAQTAVLAAEHQVLQTILQGQAVPSWEELGVPAPDQALVPEGEQPDAQHVQASGGSTAESPVIPTENQEEAHGS